MLVLTRKRRESIMIGDDIEVTVLAIEGAKVRLGIAAPRDVSVHRSEIYRAVRAQGEAGEAPSARPRLAG